MLLRKLSNGWLLRMDFLWGIKIRICMGKTSNVMVSTLVYQKKCDFVVVKIYQGGGRMLGHENKNYPNY
jgi:hypothetical protein